MDVHLDVSYHCIGWESVGVINGVGRASLALLAVVKLDHQASDPVSIRVASQNLGEFQIAKLINRI